MDTRKSLNDFQGKYPTREEKEAALRAMSNEEIDVLINAASTKQAKIFYSKFKDKSQNN